MKLGEVGLQRLDNLECLNVPEDVLTPLRKTTSGPVCCCDPLNVELALVVDYLTDLIHDIGIDMFLVEVLDATDEVDICKNLQGVLPVICLFGTVSKVGQHATDRWKNVLVRGFHHF